MKCEYFKKYDFSTPLDDNWEAIPNDGFSINTNKRCLKEIDYLPESFFMIGLKGQGKVSLSSFSISGKERPRPEYINVGIFQKPDLATTIESCWIKW